MLLGVPRLTDLPETSRSKARRIVTRDPAHRPPPKNATLQSARERDNSQKLPSSRCARRRLTYQSLRAHHLVRTSASTAPRVRFHRSDAMRSGRMAPFLPDGLVLLTSASALTYVANKAVAKNAPGILSATLDSGSGSPKVGDTIRIHGFNFIPAGGATEEALTRVRVRFAGVESPVAPPEANAEDPAVNDGAAPAADGSGTQRAPSLYADNVTATDLRVTIPPLTGIQLPRTVELTVVTAAGIETPPYLLTIAAGPTA